MSLMTMLMNVDVSITHNQNVLNAFIRKVQKNNYATYDEVFHLIFNNDKVLDVCKDIADKEYSQKKRHMITGDDDPIKKRHMITGDANLVIPAKVPSIPKLLTVVDTTNMHVQIVNGIMTVMPDTV